MDLGLPLPSPSSVSAPLRETLPVDAQIRLDKFDLILPEAMRNNGIDMRITVMKEGYRDPLYQDLGNGSPGRNPKRF